MPETPDQEDPRPITVFLLDDNPDAAAGLQRWFKRSREFRWGGWLPSPEGIEDALARTVPDVLLVDWDLPGTDTAALLGRLTHAFPNMHIAVLSAHLNPAYIRAALAAGAAGYVFKGQAPSHLAAEVQLLGEGKHVLSVEAQQALGAE